MTQDSEASTSFSNSRVSRYTLAQAVSLERFHVLDAVQYAPLQFQKYRSDTFGPPAFQCGFANVPTVGQLALVEVFDTHVLVLSCDCENVLSVSNSGCAGVSRRHVRADVRAQPKLEKKESGKQKTARRRLCVVVNDDGESVQLDAIPVVVMFDVVFPD